MRLHAAVLLTAAVAFTAPLAGCSDCRHSPTEGAPASSAPLAVRPLPSASVSARPTLPPVAKCRAASLVGPVHLASLDGAPLEAGVGLLGESADVPEDDWLILDPGSRVTAKHPRSTRETTFVGPGRVRSCVGYGEEAWLVEGKFVSTGSSGERPGAEEWVVTPVGVVRYGSAKLEVTVTAATPAAPGKVEVAVSSGAAYAWTAGGASPVRPPEVLPPGFPNIPDGWTRLEGPRSITLTGKAGSADQLAEGAAERCATEARAARDVAVAVANPDGGLAHNATKHVIARHLARASCAVADLVLATLPAGALRTKLDAEVKEADATWRSGRPHGVRGRPR